MADVADAVDDFEELDDDAGELDEDGLEGLDEDGADELEEEVAGDGEDAEPVVDNVEPFPVPTARRARPVQQTLPGLFDPDAGDEGDAGDGAEWPVVLLDGELVKGPFYRPAPDGGPMLDVYEFRIVRGKEQRGSHVGRLQHDADEEDLLREFEAGTWYLAIRAPNGTFLAGNTVSVGRRGQVGRGRPEVAPAPTAIELLIAGMAKQQETLLATLADQGRQAKELREQLAAAELKRIREENALFKRQLAALLEGRPSAAGGATPAGIEDPIAVLERAEALRARMRKALGLSETEETEPEAKGGLLDELDDFLGDAGGDAEKLLSLASKLKNVADVAPEMLKAVGGGSGDG